MDFYLLILMYIIVHHNQITPPLEMSVRRYVFSCCCVREKEGDNSSPPRVNYQPFTNESLDNKGDSQSIELATFPNEEAKSDIEQSHTSNPGQVEGGTWRDEDLCFKHRRVLYCRRTSMSMTNLFDPLQLDKEEEVGQALTTAQKRCTYPPSRRKNGMKMLVGHNALQHYRKLDSDSDTSSRDSVSMSSSSETQSSVEQEPEVTPWKISEQIVDRNCHANKGYIHVGVNIPEEELPRLGSNCPLCTAEKGENTLALNT